MQLTEMGKTRSRLNHLATQLAVANTHLHIYQKLRTEFAGSLKGKFYKSKDFWGFTLSAHFQIAVLNLCRLYDDHKCAFSLHRFLKDIPKERFKPPENDLWNTDIAYVSGQSLFRPLVKLKEWRYNIIGLTNYRTSSGGMEEFLEKNPVAIEEIQKLIDDGFSILERWTYHYEDKCIQERIDDGRSQRRTYRRLSDGSKDVDYLLELMRSDSGSDQAS